MYDFDVKERTKGPVKGRRYFIWHNDSPYPPKRILSRAIKVPTSKFSGGRVINQVFRDLGFVVVTPKNRQDRKRRGFDKLPPSKDALVKKLLHQKWSRLVRNFRHTADGKYPGVYLLAYSDRNLSGKSIKESDIFYVGMSNTSVSTRLNQFIAGIHSAAMRFRENWGRYKKFFRKWSFYVAIATIPCETEKGFRTEPDLCKLGRICELEYALLARVKRTEDFEPLLNRK